MKSSLLFILLLSLFGACSNTKEVTSTNESNQQMETNRQDENLSTTKSETYVFQNVAQGDSVFASLERGYCFGRCPVFKMTIYNNGEVHLHAIAFMSKEGNYTTKIDRAKMQEFIDKAEAIQFFEMKDVYDNPHITDIPSATSSIVINGKRKTVFRRADFPPVIKAFEKLFDDLIETADWQYIGGGTEK